MRSVNWMRLWFVFVCLAFTGFTSRAALSAETVTYYYTNQQGTPLATADASGHLLGSSEYKPYGSQAAGMAAPGPGYTGHVNDPDSGLVYMQARYYDPVLARFLAADPSLPSAGGLASFSRYSYASENPVSNVDSDGRQTLPLSSYQIDWRDPRTRAFEKNVALNMIPGYGIAQCASNGCGAGQWAMAGVGSLPLVAPVREAAMLGEAAEATEESVTLYRAVSPAELESIQSTGEFSLTRGIISKYFATSAEGAAREAKALNKFGDGPYTTVSAKVPMSTINRVTNRNDFLQVDGGVESYLLYEEDLKGLQPVVQDYSALPLK